MPMSINSPRFRSVVVSPGGGERLSSLGVEIALKTGSAQTDGQWVLLEYSAPPRFAGPPPHWHKLTTEIFYVLDGELSVQIDGELRAIGAGGCVLIPPGVIHAFGNPHNAPTRFLLVASPAGLDHYFAELEAMTRSEPSWPPHDLTALRALMARYDTYTPAA